jgi:hypothetical protein
MASQELKEPLVCPECHLLHVVGMHSDLVVAGAKISLGEELGVA